MRKTLCSWLVLLVLMIAREARPQENLPWGGGTPPAGLFALLQDLNKQYGPDAVTLVSWLLDAAIHSGSMLTTSIQVNGDETRENAKFLVFQVDTGLIFNTRTVDQNGRLTMLWDKILARAFTHLETLRVPTDGIMVNLIYHSKSFPETDDISEHVDEPGPLEVAKFYFRTEPLRADLSKELPPQTLLSQSQVLINDTPTTLTLPAEAVHTNAADNYQGATQS